MHDPRIPSSFGVCALAIAALCCATPLTAQYNGEWPLDATSGTTAMDISGNSNDGTLLNFGAAPWLPGQIGNSLMFDGVDDYVSLTTQTSVYDGQGGPYSISYWVKAPAQPNAFVYAEGTIGTIAILVFGSGQYLADADKFRVYCRNDQGDVPFTGLSNAVVYDDTWHHVAFVDVAGDITLYVDGVVDTGNIAYDPMRLPGMPGHGTFSNNTASMGALRRGTVCCQMNGQIDDLRVYRFAMTAVDVQLAMAGVPVLPPSASIGSYGVGCGAGPLDLVGGGSAQIGGSGLQLTIAVAQPNALGLLAFGIGAVLPVDLTPLGYVGCTFYPQNPVTAFAGVADAVGNVPTFTFPIPANPALTYAQLNCQGVTWSPTTLEFSDVVLATLGG